MGCIPPISNKLGPSNMAPMASKTWVLRRSILSFRSVLGTHLLWRMSNEMHGSTIGLFWSRGTKLKSSPKFETCHPRSFVIATLCSDEEGLHGIRTLTAAVPVKCCTS